jgi:hypothetical protein
MPLDDRLEHYLARLDRALTAISISDRADIVTEIKSHALSAMEREPKPSLDSVLAALGEPEIVANHYLLERGLKPGKPPVSPIVKWIVIGFLGTLATFVILIALLLKAAGPVIKVSDKEDRVTLLGGFIDIDGKKGTVKIGDSFIDGGNAKTEKFQGSAPGKAEPNGSGTAGAASTTKASPPRKRTRSTSPRSITSAARSPFPKARTPRSKAKMEKSKSINPSSTSTLTWRTAKPT